MDENVISVTGNIWPSTWMMADPIIMRSRIKIRDCCLAGNKLRMVGHN